MDKLHKVMPKVFVVTATLLLLGLAASITASLLGSDAGILLGVVAGSFGYGPLKAKVSELPGIKGKV